jgi:hypothetical protein
MMYGVEWVRQAKATWVMVAAAINLAAGTGVATAQAPRGDCNGDGAVTVDELITGVNVALGSMPLSSCPSFDGNGDGRVTVDELIEAVNVALTGGPPAFAFVVATDFQTGSFGTIALDESRTVTQASASRSINSDAVARTYGGLVYVVNRFGADNIQVLDPAHDFATVLQCSTGAGSNPNDIAFVSNAKAYVALLAEKNLLIVNPSARADCSDFVLGSIDLSAYADSDGIPDMNQLAVVGNTLFVSLQRLDQNFMPAERGALVAIDTASDQITTTIELADKNPFGQTKGLTQFDGELLVGEVGLFGVNDGGVEQINPNSATSDGFLITEEELGGDITDFAFLSPERAFAIISNPDFTTSLVAFDPTTRSVTQTLVSHGMLSDIELDNRGELFLADRSTSTPGVRIFRASDGVELTVAPLDLGLPPFDIVFVP